MVFKVLPNGREFATSPATRVRLAAWRFDVEVPAGANRINRVTMLATAPVKTSLTG